MATQIDNEKGLLGLCVVPIELPKGRWYVSSHLDNIDYCLDLIKRYSTKIVNPVIGYIVARSLGTFQMDHSILPLEEAKELQEYYNSRNIKYRYLTLDQLLEKKKNVDDGIYEVDNKQIIGFSEEYRRKMGWIK